MRLGTLLAALPEPGVVRPCDDADPVIRGIVYDSRAVSPGDLFVALPGALADGHDYLPQALELGAAALIVEQLPAGLDLGGRPAAIVKDARRALAAVARSFYGDPSAELTLVGVTGTNGKTSTTYLVESILQQAGLSTGLIGTVEARYADRRERVINTTPESLDLQRMLRAMRTVGIECVAMEVSSHGIEMGRVAGCRFRVGAITNVTQDHLDYHGTMEAYRAAKARFFRNHLDPESVAVVNLDDDAASEFLDAARAAGAHTLGVSRENEAADVLLEGAEVTLSGSHARLLLPDGALDVELPLIGDFNLENLLVASGIAVALGIERSCLARGVARCRQVPGRVERVGEDVQGAPTILVDYAHTPDAVAKLLQAVRPLCAGRLVTVFGCGGDRDRSKRPLMAQAAARYSDRVVATSDNPRTEDPLTILEDIETGLSALVRVDPDALHSADRAYTVVPDRREAIGVAVGLADPEDTVVLAGKGHEDYQIVGREKLPFDDRVEALRALEERGAA